MVNKEMLYEDEHRSVRAAEDASQCIITCKDDTAAVYDRISNYLKDRLSNEAGVPADFIKTLSEGEYVRKTAGTPEEVCLRAGADGLEPTDKNVPEALADLAVQAGTWLKKFFLGIGLELTEVRLTFGKDADGVMVLTGAISPETCLFRDATTKDEPDPDTFRREVGSLADAYREMLSRVSGTQEA